MNESTTRKNPSRENCEHEILRILNTEIKQTGKNTHFRSASDFMKYFESLYPTSGALAKQVQRAVKSLDMPKDKDGYFIINKTKQQYANECEISKILKQNNSYPIGTSNLECVFLNLPTDCSKYVISLFNKLDSLKETYITIIETTNGIIFLTENKDLLLSEINDIISL